MKFRPERVSSLIREILAVVLLKEIEIPGVVITLTEVAVTKDLSEARAKVSVLPSEHEEKVMEIIQRRAPYLEGQVTKKMNIKPMPKIFFGLDHGPERAAAIEKALLKDNNRNKNG